MAFMSWCVGWGKGQGVGVVVVCTPQLVANMKTPYMYLRILHCMTAHMVHQPVGQVHSCSTPILLHILYAEIIHE